MNDEQIYAWVKQQVMESLSQDIKVKPLAYDLAYDTDFELGDISTYATVRKACNRLAREGVLVHIKRNHYYLKYQGK